MIVPLCNRLWSIELRTYIVVNDQIFPLGQSRNRYWSTVYRSTVYVPPAISFRLPFIRLRLRLFAYPSSVSVYDSLPSPSVFVYVSLSIRRSSRSVYIVKRLRFARLFTSVLESFSWPSLLVGTIRQVPINQILLNITDLRIVKFLDMLCLQHLVATLPGITKRECQNSSTFTQAETHGDYSMYKTGELQLLGAPMSDLSYKKHCSLTCVCSSGAEQI